MKPLYYITNRDSKGRFVPNRVVLVGADEETDLLLSEYAVEIDTKIYGDTKVSTYEFGRLVDTLNNSGVRELLFNAFEEVTESVGKEVVRQLDENNQAKLETRPDEDKELARRVQEKLYAKAAEAGFGVGMVGGYFNPFTGKVVLTDSYGNSTEVGISELLG